MDNAALLAHLETALRSITHPHFYEDERGFQGELLVALRKSIPEGLLPERAVIQQEYQKRLGRHGLNQRPDIVIHEPFEFGEYGSRREGNYMVIALKRNATTTRAEADLEGLVAMCDILDYPAAAFINIASSETYADSIPDSAKGRITCFAVAPGADGGVSLTRAPI
nr:hypothetical protein [uncultured Caldimonas sp.]